jgi:ketosteroid isomerase-like protein
MIMRRLAVISLILIGTLILQCQPAIGDDVADLKAANESIDEALNAGDADALIAVFQDGAVLIMGTGFPEVTNNATLLPGLKRFLENNTVRATWYKVDYRVIGDTGLVWGVTIGNRTNKATNVRETDYNKACRVFVKSEGKWKMVMLHASPIVLE